MYERASVVLSATSQMLVRYQCRMLCRVRRVGIKATQFRVRSSASVGLVALNAAP